MKYRAMPGIASYFGKELGVSLANHPGLGKVDLVLPVPLHPLRVRERGYNQASLLAREIGREIDCPVNEKVLCRRRYTNQQAKFNKQERAQNVRSAFQVSDPNCVAAKNIILVDDVLTTGSTMNECAKVLKESGAMNITAVTVVRI
jgi:ComF family protein